MIDYNKVDNLKKKLLQLVLKLKENPALGFVVIGLLLIFVFMFFGSSRNNSPQPHPLNEQTVPFDKEGNEIVGVMESVDPRDMWTAKIEQKVQNNKDELTKQFEERKKASELEVVKLGQEVDKLKELLVTQQKVAEEQRLAEALNISNPQGVTSHAVKVAPVKTLGIFTKNYGDKKRNVKDYVTSGSFANAVLEIGVVVGTGSNSVSNPEPIILRLTDAAIFSNFGRTHQIKEALIIGDCNGDLSSERAKCRLQTLSLRNRKGEIIEKPIEGWIIGKDGRSGIRGIVVDKSSDMLRMAMLNGVLGGMSQFLQNQATAGVFPISPITGQQKALNGTSTLKAGMAHGTGDAFSKMADFVMERFNSMSPQIVVDAGLEVAVVFRQGVDLNANDNDGSQRATDGNLRTNGYRANNYQSHDSSIQQQNAQYPNMPQSGSTDPYAQEGFNAFGDTNHQMNIQKKVNHSLGKANSGGFHSYTDAMNQMNEEKKKVDYNPEL